MLKKLISTMLILYSVTIVACPTAEPTDSAAFCSSFRLAAVCYCTSSGLPAGVCQDVKSLYNRMLIIFGTLKRACEYQHYTETQDCIDNWKCYLEGGVDSRGRSCSSTQLPCT